MRLENLLIDPKIGKQTKHHVAGLLLCKDVALASTPADTVCKFHLGELVRHLKSGGEYIIVGLPINHRLEATGEPCYAYQGADGLIWHRGRAEMEDGRFASAHRIHS